LQLKQIIAHSIGHHLQFLQIYSSITTCKQSRNQSTQTQRRRALRPRWAFFSAPPKPSPSSAQLCLASLPLAATSPVVKLEAAIQARRELHKISATIRSIMPVLCSQPTSSPCSIFKQHTAAVNQATAVNPVTLESLRRAATSLCPPLPGPCYRHQAVAAPFCSQYQPAIFPIQSLSAKKKKKLERKKRNKRKKE
jgi:hypothetical protein